jgi:hypothetical protein
MAAKWTDFVSGAVLTAAQLNSVLDNFQDIAIFNESQASNTAGGTFTSGSYQKRVLNTTVVNNITGCSIASSVVTLPAGTFYIRGVAPAYNVNANKVRLQNTTAATTIRTGTVQRTASSDATGCNAVVETVVTFTVTTTIELQHRCETTINNQGYGVPCNFGDDEVYSSLYIARIA